MQDLLGLQLPQPLYNEISAKRFRNLPVDLYGLNQIDIHDDCVHRLSVCRVLKQHPRIAPVRNDRFPAHHANVSLLPAKLKTGQFLDAFFDLIHRHRGLPRKTYKFESSIHSRSSPYARQESYPICLRGAP